MVVGKILTYLQKLEYGSYTEKKLDQIHTFLRFILISDPAPIYAHISDFILKDLFLLRE